MKSVPYRFARSTEKPVIAIARYLQAQRQSDDAIDGKLAYELGAGLRERYT